MADPLPKRVIASGAIPRANPPFTTAAYTLETAADVVAVQQLLARYCHLLDSDASTSKSIAELFAPKGKVQPVYEGDKEYEGRDEIATWYAAYLRANRKGSRLRRHLISTTRVEVRKDQAWAFSLLDYAGVNIEAKKLQFAAGFYEDDLVKIDGRWFFAHRRIALDYAWAVADYALRRNGQQVVEGEVEK